MHFRLGCAVWGYKDWVGDLFPPGSRNNEFLALYSRRLTSVEGNTTFYATPNPDVVQRWAAETPEDFEFCFKLPRAVSHAGTLAAQLETTRAFVERLEPLGPRLGPFFLQLPPGYGPERMRDLERWLAAWPPEQRVAVEVRHDDWYEPPHEQALIELLASHRAGRVVMDVRPLSAGPLPGADADLVAARDRKPDVPMHPVVSADFALVRYIGHPTPELNDPLLGEWAERVAQWLADGIAVSFFCHCPDERQSPGLCRAFQHRLARLADIPPLPWDAADTGPEQLAMF